MAKENTNTINISPCAECSESPCGHTCEDKAIWDTMEEEKIIKKGNPCISCDSPEKDPCIHDDICMTKLEYDSLIKDQEGPRRYLGICKSCKKNVYMVGNNLVCEDCLKSDQMTIVKDNIWPCAKCSIQYETDGCDRDCHLLEAWKKESSQQNKKYIIRTPLDDRTCSICSENNGKIIDIIKDENLLPPFHGYGDKEEKCRCYIEEIKEQYNKEPSDCLFEFKGDNCKYQGPTVKCNRTLEDCRLHGNSKNFGGFPGLPKNKKMIPTMRVNYFDGSYYVVRKDKPGWEDIIESINKKKGWKFISELSRKEQIKIIQNVDLVKVIEVEMTEEDYMKIPASPEIGKIQLELKGKSDESKS